MDLLSSFKLLVIFKCLCLQILFRFFFMNYRTENKQILHCTTFNTKTEVKTICKDSFFDERRSEQTSTWEGLFFKSNGSFSKRLTLLTLVFEKKSLSCQRLRLLFFTRSIFHPFRKLPEVQLKSAHREIFKNLYSLRNHDKIKRVSRNSNQNPR